MTKYIAGVFCYDNDWIDNAVLDSLVGKTFFSRFLDSMVALEMVKCEGQLAIKFEVADEIETGEYYIDMAASCQGDPETGDVISIDYIEEIFLTKAHANTEIMKLEVVYE